jgi:hypothetical protein
MRILLPLGDARVSPNGSIDVWLLEFGLTMRMGEVFATVYS